jgi:hypothetical protein
MGIDFNSAADGMGANINEAVKKISAAEVSMLDGMIAVLENIVAMEKLGDITADDTELELGDIVITGGDAVDANGNPV